MKRSASAHWTGDLKTGKGKISTESGALKDNPYGFNTRFEDQPGTNPEELIGAAHAGCFSMALSMILKQYELTAKQIDTKADVKLEEVDGDFAITAVHLTLKAKIPGVTKEQFEQVAGVVIQFRACLPAVPGMLAVRFPPPSRGCVRRTVPS